MVRSRRTRNRVMKTGADGQGVIDRRDRSDRMVATVSDSSQEETVRERAPVTPGEGRVTPGHNPQGRTTRVEKIQQVAGGAGDVNTSQVVAGGAGDVNTSQVVTFLVVIHLVIVVPLALHYIPSGRNGIFYYYYNRTEGESYALWPQEAEMGRLPITAATHAIFIIHGFSESSHRPWIKRLTHALLAARVEEERVVVVVDYWDFHSLIYPRVRKNASKVASLVAQLIDTLVIHNNLQLAKTHLIGFSLGGRISGMVGDRITTGKVARITGIDASYPWTPPKTKDQFLDAGDASLVVNIRTSPVGSHAPPSHIDFYANGGLSQPGCDDWYFPYLVQQVCNHYRSVALMIEAVKHADDRVFPACGCPDWESFKNHTCDCQTVNNFGLYPNTRNPHSSKKRICSTQGGALSSSRVICICDG
nr:lipase member H-like isoform X2 [Procambarus clarkii]